MAHRSSIQDPAAPEVHVCASRYRTSDATRLEASVLAEASDVKEAAAGSPRPASAREAPLSIVVADDEPDMRAYVKRCLRLMRRPVAPVGEAADGEAALAIIREVMSHLIVSATRLPEMDGFMLCHAIRAEADLSHILVLLVSGETLINANEQRARQAGASGFLSKPFNARQLCTALDGLLHVPPS